MEKRNYKVYMHTCPNGKKYVGLTMLEPKLRWQRGNAYNRNIYFYKAILKYGWENIKHEILFEGLTKEEAEQKEIELIAFYKSNNIEFGYNIMSGGNSNGKHCEDTKLKMATSQKERFNKERKLFGKINSVRKNKGCENGIYFSYKIDKETYDKLSAISKRTDIPIVRLIRKAVELLEVKNA